MATESGKLLSPPQDGKVSTEVLMQAATRCMKLQKEVRTMCGAHHNSVAQNKSIISRLSLYCISADSEVFVTWAFFPQTYVL